MNAAAVLSEDALSASENIVSEMAVNVEIAMSSDGPVEASSGDRGSVVIRGHSFSMNQPSRRSTIDASGVSTAQEVAAESNASTGAVVAKQPRRSSFSDAV